MTSPTPKSLPSSLPVGGRWNIKVIVIAADVQPDDVRVVCGGANDTLVGLPLLQILLGAGVVSGLRIRQISGDNHDCRLHISLQIRSFIVEI